MVGRTERHLAGALFVLTLLFTTTVSAETPRAAETGAPSGTAVLLRSTDPSQVALGAMRAAALSDPESLHALAEAIAPPSSARMNRRSLVEVVRALVLRARENEARDALISLLSAPLQLSFASGAGDREAGKFAVELAAYGLAKRADCESILALAGASGQRDPIRLAATSALGQLPFGAAAGAIAWGVTRELLAHGAVALAAAAHGDSRALPYVKAAVASATDLTARAAALEAWGESGDPAAVAFARTVLAHPFPALRTAATRVVAAHAAEGGEEAVAALVVDSATSADGISLAAKHSGEKIGRALIALLMATSDGTLRRRALLAQSCQHGDEVAATEKLYTVDPKLRRIAFYALARTESAAALVALESFAREPLDVNDLARAYLTRRLLFSESSPILDALVATLRKPADGRGTRLGAGPSVIHVAAGFPGAPEAEWRNRLPLASVYSLLREEPNPFRRRALSFALAAYPRGPIEIELFEVLAASDPDPTVRMLAGRLCRFSTPKIPPRRRVLWVMANDESNRGGASRLGTLFREDGPDVEFAFDEDGVALIEVETAGELHVDSGDLLVTGCD